MRRYKALARDWRRATFGRRASLYFWSFYALALLALAGSTPLGWKFTAGFILGAIGIGVWMLPDALMPDHIARWQRGAWGEQNTAKALKPLKKLGWVVRHDLATGYGYGNRDHIAVGPAVYLLDSKLLKDEVWLDGAGLHVRRLDETHDEYVIPDLSERMGRAARALKRDLDAAVGFPVAVYPVVVIWGHFAAGEQWDAGAAYVDGDRLSDWLERRPADLRDERKREAVQSWLRALQRAGDKRNRGAALVSTLARPVKAVWTRVLGRARSSSPPSVELTTIEEFREAVSARRIITITDTATGNHSHASATCSFVREDFFRRKVIENKCRNGHYYVVSSVEQARQTYRAEPCHVCRPG